MAFVKKLDVIDIHNKDKDSETIKNHQRLCKVLSKIRLTIAVIENPIDPAKQPKKTNIIFYIESNLSLICFNLLSSAIGRDCLSVI